ncbi:MAG TPA: hypothetical protein PLS49_09375 [Candidatus Woesebacteria bacterium]|nr:hypothetical protein [Candidatus Woesebacteria bacterium]
MSQLGNNQQEESDAEKRRKEVIDLINAGVDSIYFQHGTGLPIFTQQTDRPSSWPNQTVTHDHWPNI